MSGTEQVLSTREATLPGSPYFFRYRHALYGAHGTFYMIYLQDVSFWHLHFWIEMKQAREEVPGLNPKWRKYSRNNNIMYQLD